MTSEDNKGFERSGTRETGARAAAPGGPAPKPGAREAAPPHVTNSPDLPSAGGLANALGTLKLPRYAHVAKRCELTGRYGEAERNYYYLAESIERSLGGDHPDLATTLYELASLNKYHIVPHDADIQRMSDQLGLERSQQVLFLYQRTAEIRAAKLGTKHPAFACSLYAMAACLRDTADQAQAGPAMAMLQDALGIQAGQADALATALTLTCMGDLAESTGVTFDRQQSDTSNAAGFYREALKLLPYQSLGALNAAAKICAQALQLSDAGKQRELIGEALALQAPLANPYYAMAFRLLADRSPDLLLDMLELHRHQYHFDYLTARGRVLFELADLAAKAGRQGEASGLQREADEIEKLVAEIAGKK